MSAPGRSHREGISLFQLFKRFPDEQRAAQWFIDQRWPDGPICPRCSSADIQTVRTGKPMPFRCRLCRRHFSVRTGTVMARSKISLRKWVVAIYLYSTSLKGVSSMKLHRDLDITQKSAWFMAHRIREALQAEDHMLEGPVEVDESYFGGRMKNRPVSQRYYQGGGSIGKQAVAAISNRTTREVRAQALAHVNRTTLRAFIFKHVTLDAKIYTDEHVVYGGLPNHEAVNHSVSQYVDGQAHTNGLESFWSLLKRAYHGTHHHFSPKHIQRYVDEMATRQSLRERDTTDLMGEFAARMVGKRLTFEDLTAGGPAYPPRPRRIPY